MSLTYRCPLSRRNSPVRCARPLDRIVRGSGQVHFQRGQGACLSQRADSQCLQFEAAVVDEDLVAVVSSTLHEGFSQ